MDRQTFTEHGRLSLGTNKSLVASLRSDGLVSLAQEVEAESKGPTGRTIRHKVFLKNALTLTVPQLHQLIVFLSEVSATLGSDSKVRIKAQVTPILDDGPSTDLLGDNPSLAG